MPALTRLLLATLLPSPAHVSLGAGDHGLHGIAERWPPRPAAGVPIDPSRTPMPRALARSVDARFEFTEAGTPLAGVSPLASAPVPTPSSVDASALPPGWQPVTARVRPPSAAFPADLPLLAGACLLLGGALLWRLGDRHGR